MESNLLSITRASRPTSTYNGPAAMPTRSPRSLSTGASQVQERPARPPRTIPQRTSSRSPTRMATSGGTDTKAKTPSSSTNSTDGSRTTCSCVCATDIRYGFHSKEASISSKLRALYSRVIKRGRIGTQESTTRRPSNEG